MKTFVYEFDGVEFEYEVDYKNVHDVLEKKFMDDYGLTPNVARNIIDDYGLWEALEENHKDYLLELFEDDARNEYEENREYNKDPYSYYGVSRNDF